MPENSPAGICGMSVVNEKVMYGAGTNDPNLPGPGLVKTTDGGATWTHTDLKQHADNLIDVRFLTRTPAGSSAERVTPHARRTTRPRNMRS